MFFGKKKLEEEVVRLKYRVAELEERLCPCEQHDMVCVDSHFVITCSTPFVDGEYLKTYKCKRCGKVIKRYDWED